MIKLSRTIVYALRATLQLAAAPQGVPVPCRQLARAGSMPERFLLQILRELVKQRVLGSTCGVAGGYFLSRAPDEVSLQDVVGPFEQSLGHNAVLLQGLAPAARSRVTDRLRAAGEAGRMELQKLTLADLLRSSVAETSGGCGVCVETGHGYPVPGAVAAAGETVVVTH